MNNSNYWVDGASTDCRLGEIHHPAIFDDEGCELIPDDGVPASLLESEFMEALNEPIQKSTIDALPTEVQRYIGIFCQAVPEAKLRALDFSVEKEE